MKTIMDIIEPEKVQIRLTMIMSLYDWEKVQQELKPDDGRELDYHHPALVMSRSLSDCFNKIKRDIFDYPEEKPE